MKRDLRPAEPVVSSKTKLRAHIREVLSSLKPADFIRTGKSAAVLLRPQELWAAHSSILIFLSMKDEINTFPIIRMALDEGKRVFVPRIDGSAGGVSKDGGLTFYRYLSAGSNCREPEAGAALLPEDFPALIITPGLAFDRSGRRLGRGKGYYDRFFAALDSGSLAGQQSPGLLPYTTLGLCLETQLVVEVPAEAHDKTMDAVLTDRHLLKTPGNLKRTG